MKSINEKRYNFINFNSHEVLAVIITTLLLSLFVYISVDSKKNFIVVMLLLAAILYMVVPYKISLNSFLTWLWLITLFFIFLGSNLASIPFGGFHIFPGRILLIAFWGIFIILTILRNGKVEFASTGFKPFLIFMVIWIIWEITTFVWASSKIDVIRSFIFLFQGFSIIFFTVYIFNNERKLELLYTFWVLLLIFMITIGVWENITSSHLPASTVSLEFGYRPWQLNIPSAVYPNPNDFATYLCLSAPFMLVLINYCKRFIHKLFVVIAVAAAFYLIVVTESRANMVGFSLIIIGWIILNFKHIRNLLSRDIYKLIIGVMLLAGLYISFMPVFGNENMSLAGKFINEVKSLGLKSGNGSISVRSNLIRNGMVYLWNSGMIGVGGGNVEWHQKNNEIYPTYGITNIHNWWGELAVNFGIFIFVLYLIFYLSMIKGMFVVYRNSNIRIYKIISEAALLALIGFPVACISSSSIFAEISVWLLYATPIALLTVYKSKEN